MRREAQRRKDFPLVGCIVEGESLRFLGDDGVHAVVDKTWLRLRELLVKDVKFGGIDERLPLLANFF